MGFGWAGGLAGRNVPAAEPPLEKEAAYVVAVIDADSFELPGRRESGDATSQAAKVVLHRHTSLPERAVDLAWHAVLPLLCYSLGFAFVTMLMKTISWTTSSDYMRTAIAKGVPFTQASGMPCAIL